MKIKDVHIYAMAGGGYAIEAIIDGTKSIPVKLSREDVLSLNEKTDRKKLALKYFCSNGEKNVPLQ